MKFVPCKKKFTIKSQKSNEEKVPILCDDGRVQPKWSWEDILVMAMWILFIGGFLLAIVMGIILLVQGPDPTPIITNELEVIEITCENSENQTCYKSLERFFNTERHFVSTMKEPEGT